MPALALQDAAGALPQRLVMVVAHPDDETLACAGLLRRAARAGVPVTLLLATAGEASHPDSPTCTPETLARTRRVELAEALAHLAPADVLWLGLPDGRVADYPVPLREAVAGRLDERALVVTTWAGDRHPDHETVARVVGEAAAAAGARHLQAPIWLWHWGSADDVPWDQCRRLDLSAEDRAVKARALAEHRSQHQPLSPRPGDEPILSPEMLAHFARDWETYVEQPPGGQGVTTGVFEQLHRDREDPWSVSTSWYEQRKRDLTLAALPVRRVERLLEVGCSVGELTAALAARAAHVTALDSSPAALDRARSRLADHPHVDLRCSRVPEQWPAGTFDGVVLSEVGYFLTPGELHEVLDLAQRSLAPGGFLLLVHWRHPVDHWPLDGPEVHRMAQELDGLRVATHLEDEDFLLTLLRSREEPTLAQAEGKA